MPIFTSSREKKLWLTVLLVFVAIFSTLFIGKPQLAVFQDQNVQAAVFLTGMVLVGATIFAHAFRTKPKRTEMVIWFGIAAVYILLILRLGLSERSHLIEYSVLAICIHRALLERFKQAAKPKNPALTSWIVTLSIGVIDESIQQLVPNRIFDPMDILFNGIAISLAIGFTELLSWFRSRGPK